MLLHQRRATSDRFSSGQLRKPMVERRLTHFGGAGEGAMAASARKRTGFWWNGGPRPSGSKRTPFFQFPAPIWRPESGRQAGAANLFLLRAGFNSAPDSGQQICAGIRRTISKFPGFWRRIPGAIPRPESGAKSWPSSRGGCCVAMAAFLQRPSACFQSAYSGQCLRSQQKQTLRNGRRQDKAIPKSRVSGRHFS